MPMLTPRSTDAHAAAICLKTVAASIAVAAVASFMTGCAKRSASTPAAQAARAEPTATPPDAATENSVVLGAADLLAGIPGTGLLSGDEIGA